jgi:Flp pilus assembly protein TadG
MRGHGLPRQIIPRLLRLAHATAGNVAIEFALVSTILVPLLLNSIDFSFLIWAKMEVESGADGRPSGLCYMLVGPATGHD